MWLAILNKMKVPPNAVELLHDNNGGFWEHISYSTDNPRAQCKAGVHDNKACAYHVCLSVCQWSYLYARHDFHTHADTNIVMGDKGNASPQRESLEAQFAGVSPVHLFSLLTALTSV